MSRITALGKLPNLQPAGAPAVASARRQSPSWCRGKLWRAIVGPACLFVCTIRETSVHKDSSSIDPLILAAFDETAKDGRHVL
jgi:hypothetical protein